MKFFAFEVAWAKVAFDTIFPGAHEAGLVSMDAMDVDGFVNETAARIPAKTAFGFRIAIWLATFAPLFVLRSFSTLGRLERGARETVLRALLASARPEDDRRAPLRGGRFGARANAREADDARGRRRAERRSPRAPSPRPVARSLKG